VRKVVNANPQKMLKDDDILKALKELVHPQLVELVEYAL
jgi:hypothetical protein